ncbi:unnamed protein product [Diatraea saccharalis]|uniref:pyruvate kinase n=1 Tax=Diatraea saccharalis TaxID=40085 RepID=A0A9N9RCS0_9NEOP|nr:unnamed protein product [Diatraea saccharalis]
MLEAGITALKLRMSKTTKGEKMHILAKLDKASLKCCKKYGVPDWPVASSIELKTCIIKTGLLESEAKSISIKEGSHIILTKDMAHYKTCNNHKIFVDNACLTTEVKIGTEISIGQDEIIVHCTEIIDDKSIQCIVTKGGQLYDLDNVSMRGIKRKRPTLGNTDFQIIKFALEYQLGKPFFLSGDILQDTLTTGEHTDREVSDITNALLDGVSGFILKQYQDVNFLIRGIKSLNKLCRSIEPYTNSKANFLRIVDEIKLPMNAAEAAMLSCVAAAYQCKARAIVVPTVTGSTARALLRMNPTCLVITVGTNINVNRLLKSYKPHHIWQVNVEAKIVFAVQYAVHRGWLGYGDKYVTLQRGTEESSFCDLVRVWPVTNYKKPLVECNYDEHDHKHHDHKRYESKHREQEVEKKLNLQINNK